MFPSRESHREYTDRVQTVDIPNRQLLDRFYLIFQSSAEKYRFGLVRTSCAFKSGGTRK